MKNYDLFKVLLKCLEEVIDVIVKEGGESE